MPQISIKLFGSRFTAGYGDGAGLFFKRTTLPMGRVSGGQYNGSGLSWLLGLLPGSKINYDAKAGERWKNGIVAAALSWIARNLPYAPLAVWTEDDNGKETIVPKHPLTKLLRHPNKFYDGKTLLQATFLSLIAGNANAYWWVKRSKTGVPLEFWYLPHFSIWPIWSDDSTTKNWITGYAYRNNSITYTLSNEEVLHFRDGIDPNNPRMGFDTLAAASRELVVDNEASSYAAQLLENMCIPGAIISPSGDAVIDETDGDLIKQKMEDKSSKDNRFRPLVLSGGVKVDKMSFTPEEMSLHTMQDRPEARLCAMIGISPMVLGLTVGLEHSTYSNYQSAEEGAWYNCIMPRIALICSELDTQVLTMFPGSEEMHVAGDYRHVPALQDDLDKKYKRLSLAVCGPYLTPDEARDSIGLPHIDGGDVLYPAPGSGSASDQLDMQGNPIKPAAKPSDKPVPKPAAKPPAKNGNGKGSLDGQDEIQYRGMGTW